MKQSPLTLRRWGRVEYERLVDLGAFEDGEPVELIGGQLIVAEPKGSPHTTAVELTAEASRAAFGPGWVVRGQDPVALDDESEPEPDVVVAPGTHRDSRDAHPSHPALLVEVSGVDPGVRPALQGQRRRQRGGSGLLDREPRG